MNPSIAASPATPRGNLWATTGFALMVLALWILLRPFRDVEHDSVLYTLFALARLHPAALGHDFFVQLGTQDRYTVFAPLYAELIRLCGIDTAAAIITFATQATFFATCWFLARRYMQPAMAMLALGLLVVLPAYYGGNLVFAYIEMFPTPRQPAEVLVLAGLIAALGGRRMLAGICMLGGMLLHPIIAAAGVALWGILFLALPRPRAALILMGLAGAVLLIAAGTLHFGPFAKFDATWFNILWGRLTYLWPTQWHDSDWYIVALTVAVLAVGALVLPGEQQRLCLAVLFTAALGLLAAILGGDLLHLQLVGEVQMWRWLWVSGLFATLLAPCILGKCWSLGSPGKAAALLLVCSWLIQGDDFMLIPAGAACLCAMPMARSLSARDARALLVGAWITLGVCVVVWLDHQRDLLHVIHITGPTSALHYAQRISQAQFIAGRSAFPALLLTLLWLAVRGADARSGRLMLLLGVVACLTVVPYAVSNWTQDRYSARNIALFEPWRKVIPEDAEVVWGGATPPVDSWMLLQRASYFSLAQLSGMVFSRELTMLGTHREDTLGPLTHPLYLSPEALAKEPQAEQSGTEALTKLCEVPDVEFMASWNDLGPTPYPVMRPPDAPATRVLRLYRCPARRKGRAPS